jgi:hypothetical protein
MELLEKGGGGENTMPSAVRKCTLLCIFGGMEMAKKRRRKEFPTSRKEGRRKFRVYKLDSQSEREEMFPFHLAFFLSRSELLLTPLTHFPLFPQNVVRFSAFPLLIPEASHFAAAGPIWGWKWKLEEEF